MKKIIVKTILGLILFYATESAALVTDRIALYGESKYPSGFKSFDYVNAQAPHGGKLILPAYGTFDNLGLTQINAKNYKSAKDFYDDLSMILGSDLNPSNFNNRLIERTDIVNSIRSVVDNYSSDALLEDELKKLQKEVESMNGMQLFMFGSTVDIETFVKELERYLKEHSDDYTKTNNYILGQRSRIRRLKSPNTSFSYYN